MIDIPGRAGVSRVTLCRHRACAGGGCGRCGESGSVSLELVLLVPVLVLLTMFVLWAGRGGRVALTSDLAAEEAVAAAALCCEEDVGGASGREALVQDVLEARPGLEFLCVGGLRPGVPPDGGGAPDGFLSERWLEFEPGRDTGGVGVLGVRFSCETDGAVAPLRGVFPTVTFHGQASEVVLREPRFVVGFEPRRVVVREGRDAELVFTVRVQPAFGARVTLSYELSAADTTAQPEDFGGTDFASLLGLDSSGVGRVNVPAGDDSAEISLPLVDDDFFEGDERLVLELTGADPPSVMIDDDRIIAVGVIEENDPGPLLQFVGGRLDTYVDEGGDPNVDDDGYLEFTLRIGDDQGMPVLDIAEEVTVRVHTLVDPAASGEVCSSWVGVGVSCDWATQGSDYEAVDETVTFRPSSHVDGLKLEHVVRVRTVDDQSSPVGEPDEVVLVGLDAEMGAGVGVRGGHRTRGGRILDDEARVSVADVSVDEGELLSFEVVLDRSPVADVEVSYRLDASGVGTPATLGDDCSDAGVDYLRWRDPGTGTFTAEGTVTVLSGSRRASVPDVVSCDDSVVEPDEFLWLEIWVDPGNGEAVVPSPPGARGTILNDDIPLVSIDPVDAVGAEGETLAFAVSLTVDGAAAVLTEPVTVDYTLEGGDDPGDASAPPAADADFEPVAPATLGATLTFPAAVRSADQTIGVELSADYLIEPDEVFRLVLDNPTGGAVLFDRDPNNGDDDEPYAVGTIEDDAPPVLSIVGFTGPEGSVQTFEVTLDDHRDGETVTVDYAITGDEINANTDTATAPGHATRPADFEPEPATDPLTGTLTFAPGTSCATACTVAVRLLHDTILEGDETLRLTLTNPNGAVLFDRDPNNGDPDEPYAVGTVTNLVPPELTVDDPGSDPSDPVLEGDVMTFTVTLDRARAGETVVVNYTVEPVSAVVCQVPSGTVVPPTSGRHCDPPEGDYLPVAGGMLTLSDTSPTATVEVQTLTDRVSESPDTLKLVLDGQSPSHVALADPVGVGTITDVNPASIRVAAYSGYEYVEGVRDINFIIQRRGAIREDVTVAYRTDGARGTATPGSNCNVPGADYVNLSADTANSVTFVPGGSTRHDVLVVTCRDTVVEGDETVALVLSLVTDNDAAVLDASVGIGTIVDRPPPDIRISNANASEGDPLEFVVGLYDGRSVTTTDELVTVLAVTEPGTAVAGEDYTHKSERVEIQPGEYSAEFRVETLADDLIEPHETVNVLLSDATNALLDDGHATGTIVPKCIHVGAAVAPVVTIEELTVIESASSISVRLFFSQPLCEEATVLRRFVEGTATSLDFHNWRQASGTVTPESSRTRLSWGFEPWTLHDQLDEDDEWAEVEVLWGDGLGGGFVGVAAVGRIWIEDDDPLPHLRVSDAAAHEGDDLAFEVSLDAVSGRTVSVQYRTVDGSAHAPADYDASDWTTIEFVPDPLTGSTPQSQTLLVGTNTDGADEGDETLRVQLRRPMNARLDDDTGVGTILEGAKPQLRIRDAAADEGDDLVFRVELSPAATHPVMVDYATVQRPQSLGAAVEGIDYDPESGRLTFDVGDEFIDLAVRAFDDGVDREINETFLMELDSPSPGVSLADPSAVGTINGDISCVEETVPAATPPISADRPVASEDAGTMTFTLRLEQPLCYTARVRVFTPGHGTATGAADYALQNKFIFFPALRTEMTFDLPLFDDDIDELDETVDVWFDADAPVNMPNVVITGEIRDDDSASVSVSAASAVEGELMVFTLRLDRPVDRVVSVAIDNRDIDASSGPFGLRYDYEMMPLPPFWPPGRVGFGRHSLASTVRVRTIEDSLFEFDETFELVLSDPSGVLLATDCDAGDCNVALGTIVDDDEPPAVRVSNPVADEGDSLVFDVTLAPRAGRDASVSFSTRDHTATEPADYTGTAGTLTFTVNGGPVHTVTVPALTDDETEGDEELFLDLSSTVLRFDKRTGTGTIRDVTQRRLSVSDAVVVEGGTLGFVVGFNGPPAGRDITVMYRTTADTAEAGGDYRDTAESAPRVLRIHAGETSAVAGVPTVQDLLDEDFERLELVLSDPVGAVIADGDAAGVIIDDDPLPLLSVDDPEATENGDGTPVTFTLTLNAPSGRDVSVLYETADGTATATDPADYTHASISDPLTFTAGETAKTVPVTLVNDDTAEDVERFRLVLSGPVNARFGDSIGVATILDDDALPQVLVDDAAATYEADGASVRFAVRLSRADPDAVVTVDYATEDATAAAGDDYTHQSDTLTFAAGQTADTVAVPLVNDDTAEETETFRLKLSNPSSNATLGNDEAVATVLDDDALPTLSVTDAPTATEGATARFSVTSSRESARPVTVRYSAVADPFGGDAAAIPGQDFDAVAGTLTIPARSTSATVAVPLRDDALNEHTETFWLRLADPTAATVLDGTGIGTIADNDPLPQISVADAGATEGDTIGFEARLEPASGRTVTVPWTTEVSLTGDPASPTDDFIAASGTLTFAPGTTTARIEITTVDDEVSESDETFQIQLGQPTNATIDDGIAVGAIRDDDGWPRISIAGTQLLESDSPATFTVTLSRTSFAPITVEYSIADGTATRPHDYDYFEQTRTLVIPAGLDEGQISVYVDDDDIAEDTETFHVTISIDWRTQAVIAEGAGTAVGHILDNDRARITLEAAQAVEGDGTIDFPVTLSHPSSRPVTVQYSTFDGSATQPDDYIATTATLTIATGATTATIPVTLTDDTFVEEAETLLVRLHDPVGAGIGTAEAVGVILDDDDLPVISFPEVWINENHGPAVFEATLSHPTNNEVRVDYSILANSWPTYICPAPYVPTSGTLRIPAGSDAGSFSLPLIDDDTRCGTRQRVQRFSVWLTNPVNARLDQRRVYGWVWDDEAPAYLSNARGFLFNAGLEGAGSILARYELNRILDEDATFTYEVKEITNQDVLDQRRLTAAKPGEDFVETSTATFTIPAGSFNGTAITQIIDDAVAEPVEDFRVLVISGPSSVDLVYPGVRVRIIDDDAPPRVSIGDVDVSEGAGTAELVVSLDRASADDVTVRYATADGTATQPDDYATADGMLTIAAGRLQEVVEVSVVDDSDVEGDETFSVVLSDAVGADIDADTATATATISDNDEAVGLPVLTVQDAEALEAYTDSGIYLRFAVTLSEASTETVQVTWAPVEVPSLGDEAATPFVDFQPPLWTGDDMIEIPAGDTEGTIWVQVFQDELPERDERFLLVLSNPVNATLGNGRAWGTIINNDLPIVSVADVSASENDAVVEFTIELHAPGVDPASLWYTTGVRSEVDAPAAPGEDYIETSGRLNIAAGVTTLTVSVPVIGDGADEPDESFLLFLSEPDVVVFANATAVGTIVDDDPGWWIEQDRSVRENAGSMVFTVLRDHVSDSDVTLDYTVAAAGSATGRGACSEDGADFESPSGSVTVPATDLRAEISIVLCDDDATEGAETLLIELTGVTGRDLTGVGTIIDDD